MEITALLTVFNLVRDPCIEKRRFYNPLRGANKRVNIVRYSKPR